MTDLTLINPQETIRPGDQPISLTPNSRYLCAFSHCLSIMATTFHGLSCRRCTGHLSCANGWERNWTSIVYHVGTDLQSAVTPPIVTAHPQPPSGGFCVIYRAAFALFCQWGRRQTTRNIWSSFNHSRCRRWWRFSCQNRKPTADKGGEHLSHG